MAAHEVPEEQREALAFAILRANVESRQVIRKRTLGEFDPPTPPATDAVNGHHLPDKTVPGKRSPLFSEALPGFIDLMVSNEGWRGQTLAQNQAPTVCVSMPFACGLLVFSWGYFNDNRFHAREHEFLVFVHSRIAVELGSSLTGSDHNARLRSVE